MEKVVSFLLHKIFYLDLFRINFFNKQIELCSLIVSPWKPTIAQTTAEAV